MDETVQNYLNNLVSQCLEAAGFSGKSEEEKEKLQEELTSYFYKVILTTLVDNLNGAQLQEFNAMDTVSDKAMETIEKLSSQVPGFIYILDDALHEEVVKIKTSGHIPKDTSATS